MVSLAACMVVGTECYRPKVVTASRVAMNPVTLQEWTMELILAYIDPGSGSLIIQALIAGMVAIPIFFRHQIARFVRAIRGGNGATAAPLAPTDDVKPDA